MAARKGGAIRTVTPFPRRPSKPLNEGSKDSGATPRWDAVPGMGQRNEQVVKRYARGK
jgi:hypothetical protein